MCRILLTAIAVVILAAADWPQALGPHRNGIVVDEALVPPVGEEMPRVLWQANAGHGVSPVVVVRGRVYVYGVFKAGSQPAGLANPATTPLSTEVRQIAAGPHAMVRSGDVPGTPEWAKQDQHGLYRGDGYVQCLDAVSGEQLWATRLTDWGIVLWGNWLAAERSSPAWSDDRLFIHTINGRLFALEAGTGRVLWEINLFDYQMLRWDEKNGNACSPLVCGDTVIVSFLAGADTERTSYQQMCVTAVAGFDVATGREKWVTKLPCEAFRSMSSDIGYAEIDNQATVLVPGGMGTAGINPVDGTIRWVVMPPWMESFRIWAQYPGRMPVAWQNHIVDCTTIAHDDKPSQTWGIRIANGKPALLWSTHDFVPVSAETDKSNLLATNEMVYGFDAHGVWDDPLYDKERGVFRSMRRDGRFQCRDIATGKLLWSSDALNLRPAGQDEYYSPTHQILVEDTLIVTEQSGLCFARLSADGLKVHSQYGEYRRWAGHLHGPPVVSDGLLYVRKDDCDATSGLLKTLGGTGNLFCLDLRPLEQRSSLSTER